jgi:hypothetical protein
VNDSDLLPLLRAAILRDEIELLLDIRRQHHVDSPLYRVSDSSLALYVLMIFVAAATYFFGWTAGAGAFAVAVLIYFFGVRRLVANRMRRRLLDEVLMDSEDFRKAWRLQGIGFRHRASGTLCESPDGLWRTFILERCAPPDLQRTT